MSLSIYSRVVKCHLGNPPHGQELCCIDVLAMLCKTSHGPNAGIQMHRRGQAAGKLLCRKPEAHWVHHEPWAKNGSLQQKPKSPLVCTRQNIGSRLRKMILLFCSALETHLECCVQSWTFQYQRDMQRVKAKGHEDEEASDEKWLKELGLFSLDKA